MLLETISMPSSEAMKLRTTPPDPWPVQFWKCPETGLVIPKTLGANLQWRLRLNEACERDAAVRAQVMGACKLSPLFWMNAFGWTYRIRYVKGGDTVLTRGPDAHYPMLTWPVQDEAVRMLMDCIHSGIDVNGAKSRDMGLSWLVLFIFVHGWLFDTERHFGVISRKEELVDTPGDMDSLFEKVRYIIKMCPSWMQPRMKWRYMMVQNLECNNTITGESTNADVGRSGRKTAQLCDEAATFINGDEIETALSQTTACQIWVSTFKGPGNQFYRRIKENRGQVIRLPWWRHPEKAEGAKQVLVDGAIKWTSPWYEKQKLRMSPRALAQEVDMDMGKAGDIFFDPDVIERHRHDHQRKPDSIGELLPDDARIDKTILAREMLSTVDHGRMKYIKRFGDSRWRFWMALEDGRPPQDMQFVFGCDVANGANHSNSVCSVRDNSSRRIVAKFWDANISPEEFALHVMMAAIWFGGAGMFPQLVWENNGPGGVFGRKVQAVGYPNYYVQRAEGTKGHERTNRMGWNSNRDTKEKLLALYREALAGDHVIQHCEEALNECLGYIYDETGALVSEKVKDESSGARELHGDHVIADALTVLGAEESPGVKKLNAVAPANSFAGRAQRERARKMMQQNRWRA